MKHTLPALPYAKNALEPYMSAETLEYHYGKHHQSYVTKLNELVKATKFEYMPLEELILSADGPIFNNAAQIWNHTFFWNCMGPNAGGKPNGKVAALIDAKWGNFDKFKEEFNKSAVDNFGSGWTWLVLNKDNKIEIFNSSNAQTPKTQGFKALMTLDVWEHAYYIDYRNERAKYVENFWDLVNWEFVNKNCP
jgi:Fe-Mn family superoxide dismutase